MKKKIINNERGIAYQIDDPVVQIPADLHDGETAKGAAALSAGIAEFLQRIEHNVSVYRDDALPTIKGS